MKHLALLLCLSATSVGAAPADKVAPPVPGTPKPFSVPAPSRFTLDNGLKVTLVPYGLVPKVTVALAIDAGAIHEGPQEVWLSELTGRMLREGTATRTAPQIADEAARMGGTLDITVGADRTEISSDVLSEFGPDVVRLLADVARNPKLPASELPRLLSDLGRELSIGRSEPQQLAFERFRRLLYGEHPYGRVFPSEASLQGYKPEQVRAFYAANYGASRAQLSVAGRFDRAAIEAAVRAAFGDWKPARAASVVAPAPHSTRGVHIIDRPGAVQSSILLGMPTLDPSSPDYVPVVVMNTLLGGSFASRITSNIREQKGYTYSPNSSVSVRRHDGYWVEQADVTTNVTGPAIKEIFGEIDRLQAGPPPLAELQAIQTYIAGTFVLRNSSRAGIIGQLDFLDLHGLPDGYLTGYVERVRAVTPQVVQEMARKYVRDDQATIVIAGDRKQIEEQVKEFGPVSVN